MTTLFRRIWILVLLFGVSPSVHALSAADIATAYGLVVSPLITQQQRPVLSPEFSVQFQSRTDLTVEALSSYLALHPLELVALRNHLQVLVNAELLDAEVAIDALGLGIEQFAIRSLTP